MGFGIAARPYVIAQIRFARMQTILGQPSTKQLVAQPDAVRVDDVGFAICRDFGYAPLATVPLDIRPANAVGLPWKPHDATQLVQRRLVLRTEGRQHVAEVDRVFGVTTEVWARRESRAATPHTIERYAGPASRRPRR